MSGHFLVSGLLNFCSFSRIFFLYVCNCSEFILEVQGIFKINHFDIPALVCSHSRERCSPVVHSLQDAAGVGENCMVLPGLEKEKFIFQAWLYLYKLPSCGIKGLHWAIATQGFTALHIHAHSIWATLSNSSPIMLSAVQWRSNIDPIFR